MIPKKTLPLLVFVNVKSGGCQVGLFSIFNLSLNVAALQDFLCLMPRNG
jgi:hypothetical protein